MNLSILVLGAALLLPTGQDTDKQQSGKAEKANAAVVKTQLPSYPLDVCVISGEKLADQDAPMNVVVEGRLVRTCCGQCAKKVRKDPAKYIAQVETAVKKAQLASYPLKVCPVSGEKLGSMGDPIDVVSGTRLVRLCCKGCVKSVKKDPGAYLAKVNAAYIEAQRPTYALKVCLISGEALEDDAVDELYGTRLVRFCCPMCVKKFNANPDKYLAKLTGEHKGEHKGDGEHKGVHKGVKGKGEHKGG
jgi:YHS domain-containing protein